MPSGLSNDEKATIRQLYRRGQGRPRANCSTPKRQSYHAAGTCTFYGTANSNQMLMEIMGLHLPGAAFVHPNTPLRDALTRRGREARARRSPRSATSTRRSADVVDERRDRQRHRRRCIATGGSTNHTMHLVAIARAAGIVIDWDDFADLSEVVPLLARIYPNGSADVNHFHAAGGMAFLIRELLDAGLLHEDVNTVAGRGLAHYAQRAVARATAALAWRDGCRNERRHDGAAPGDASRSAPTAACKLLQRQSRPRA